MKTTRIARLRYANLRQLGCATIIGLLAGLVVSLFRWAIQNLLNGVIRAFGYFHGHPFWLLPWSLASILVALFLGRLVQKNPDIKGSGIPQVEGQLTGQFDEKWWPVLWRKFFGGIISIGSGLFLGREGPSIQLGATVGQGIAEKNTGTEIERRVGIASGAAAGLSAAFNAPIASTMFILEEVYHNFSPLVWLSVFISSLAANLVSMAFFGLAPDLNVPHEVLLPASQYWHLILLGILLGLLGRLYQVVILQLPKWMHKLHFLKPAWYPVIPFLLVIPIAWWWPITLGGGNNLVVALPKMPAEFKVMLGLFILRFVFSMISYASELPGGIFLPILTLGGIIGALYCAIMIHWGLIPAKYLPNYVICAMAGYFACISKAPFTAILLITEMVGTLTHLMPLAIVSIVAWLVVDLMGGTPIYAAMFANMMHKQPQRELLGLTQMTTPIFVGSVLDGCLIKDFDWPAGALITCIYRGENQLIPHGNTRLKAGDTLVVQLRGKNHIANQARINAAARQSLHD